MSDAPKEEQVEVKIDCSNPDVVTKYRKAADIANLALSKVASLCVPNALIVDICKAGDDIIREETGKVYNKGTIEKGVGFPTCINVNNICGHYSPLVSDPETRLKEGDVVKIDLGVQIDGYMAAVASTVALSQEKITGKVADLLVATQTCSEAAIRLLKAGKTNEDITNAINKICVDYKVTPLAGVLSHNLDRFVIDGDKVIINSIKEAEHKVETFTFEPLQVFALDVVLSTGSGKAIQSELRTTVYRRNADATYNLKMNASRQVYSEIKKNAPSHPFTLSALDSKLGKIGIKECADHGLCTAFPVITEKDGEYVAQVKFTAILLPGGTIRITHAPIDISKCESEFSVTDEEVKALLSTSSGGGAKKKKNNKKKKAAGAKADAAEEDEAEE